MRARVRLACTLLCAVAVSGCVVLDLMRGRYYEERAARYAYLAGTVTEEAPGDHWLVVYLVRVPCDEDWEELQEHMAAGGLPSDESAFTPEAAALADRLGAKAQVVEHVLRRRPGRWFAQVVPGCYGVGAFSDVDGDFAYEDEPAASAASDPRRVLLVQEGERHENLDVVIPVDGRLMHDPTSYRVPELEVRSHKEQLIVSLEQIAVNGEVADLADERLSPQAGKLGYYDIFEFVWRNGAGVYFLESYDPARVPVLFVHGALGFPREFATLIAGLDRTRFQPWVYSYPSGAELDGLAEFLLQRVLRLHLLHGFGEMAVVAHSMGGLVSRAFLFKLDEAEGPDVPVFVSISTPWGGVPSARSGVESSPVVVPSWRSITPGSDFLHGIFFEGPAEAPTRRPLPAGTTHHLLFGVGDQSIPLTSAIRWEAVRGARQRWPLPYDHTAILRSSEASQLLGEVLDSRF